MEENSLMKYAGALFKPHPWHGISIGRNAPEVVTAYIEIVPTDTIKYELDKQTGYLKVDRPQRFSNIVTAMYGFVPQTFCNDKVAEFCIEKTNRKNIVGDGDPLDICILSEKTITHGGIILEAIPIGGFRMLDGSEADDKLIAVMKDDAIYGDYKDIKDIPEQVIERLRHYFLTYKDIPGGESPRCEITHTYGKEEAYEVIKRSREDYQIKYGYLENIFNTIMKPYL